MNAAVLANHGEAVDVGVGASSFSDVEAVFFDPYKGETAKGIQIERPGYEFAMRLSDWNATGGAAGASVTRANGDVYTVVDVVPEGATDWVTLKVRAQ